MSASALSCINFRSSELIKLATCFLLNSEVPDDVKPTLDLMSYLRVTQLRAQNTVKAMYFILGRSCKWCLTLLTVIGHSP